MTDNTFQRERRYIVIKRKHLTDSQERSIREYLDDIGAHTIRAVVVEEDWPEYEPVWQMIEARVSGHATPAQPVADKPEAVLTPGAARWLADAAGSRERLATFPEHVQQSLDAWQTERGEWFDDTVLEIVAEYAAWATPAQPDVAALVDAAKAFLESDNLVNGENLPLNTADYVAAVRAVDEAKDALRAALQAWKAQHGSL